jgi:hypothetical protein
MKNIKKFPFKLPCGPRAWPEKVCGPHSLKAGPSRSMGPHIGPPRTRHPIPKIPHHPNPPASPGPPSLRLAAARLSPNYLLGSRTNASSARFRRRRPRPRPRPLLSRGGAPQPLSPPPPTPAAARSEIRVASACSSDWYVRTRCSFSQSGSRSRWVVFSIRMPNARMRR